MVGLTWRLSRCNLRVGRPHTSTAYRSGFFFVCVIAGQLVGAVIADYIGAFGLVSRDLSISKLVGVFMAFLAVLFVRFG